MNAYGRYVHIFLGVVLFLPLLILMFGSGAIIIVLFSVFAFACAIAGMALIVRGVTAPGEKAVPLS